MESWASDGQIMRNLFSGAYRRTFFEVNEYINCFYVDFISTELSQEDSVKQSEKLKASLAIDLKRILPKIMANNPNYYDVSVMHVIK